MSSHIVIIQNSVTWVSGILTFDVGTNSDEYGADYDSAGDSAWPNGTRSDSARMWRTFSELSLTEVFPFDDHALFSLPLRHNCLHRYKSLSLYFVKSSLTEIPLVWTLFRNSLELRRIRNLVLTELSLAIIWRGSALCLWVSNAARVYILFGGKLRSLLVFWPWHLLNWIQGCHITL